MPFLILHLLCLLKGNKEGHCWLRATSVALYPVPEDPELIQVCLGAVPNALDTEVTDDRIR